MWNGTNPHPGRLEPLAGGFSSAEPFEEAQPLTVRLRGVMVREDYDGVFRGGNDLVIVTKFQVGDEPPVERLHYMRSDTSLGWHGDFFHAVVFSTRDFRGERLTLQLRAYDVDNVEDQLIQSVGRLAEQVAGLFPQLAPYLGAVDFAVGPFVELVNNIDDHDRILNDQVTLEVPHERRGGRKPLTPGYVVCSKEPIGDGCTLGDDLRIRRPDGGRHDDCSYAVFGLLRDHLVGRQYEINQRAAKLIAELKGKGQSERSPIFFLQETLDAYATFRKLQRARELQSRESLTAAEERLLADLKSREKLEPYLRDG